jgi:hypothetical protein
VFVFVIAARYCDACLACWQLLAVGLADWQRRNVCMLLAGRQQRDRRCCVQTVVVVVGWRERREPLADRTGSTTFLSKFLLPFSKISLKSKNAMHERSGRVVVGVHCRHLGWRQSKKREGSKGSLFEAAFEAVTKLCGLSPVPPSHVACNVACNVVCTCMQSTEDDVCRPPREQTVQHHQSTTAAGQSADNDPCP